MIEGRTVLQISKVFKGPPGQRTSMMIEREHDVVRFKQYLKAGRLPGGAVRPKALIQFQARDGLWTVNAEDIVL